MPIDPSIPLQAGQNIPQFGTSPTQQLTLARLALALQQQRQQQSGINALRMLYANPQNLDANGMPTPGSVNKLMQVSPQLGMQMQNALAMNEERQARMGYLRSAEGDRAAKQLRGATEEALGTYDEGIRAGMTPQQAQARGQQVLSSTVADLRASGTMPGMVGANPRFDPIAARGMLFNYQRDQAQQLEQKKLDQSQQQGQQKLSLQRDKLGLDTQKAQNANYGPPQMVEVPGVKDQPPRQVIGRFDRVTGKYFDLDGNLLKPTRIIPASQNLSGGEMATGPTSNLHGADYLGTLGAADANQVKALAEGRMQFPSGRALRSPYWTNKLLQVSQYDPGFDAVNYGARFTTRKDFTSGKSAQAITSFNTAIGHLGTLYKAADQLGNSWSPTYNSVKNFLYRNSGSPTVVRFNTAKQAVADELTRAFRGTSGNVSDIKDWEENINAAESPEQLHEAIKQAVELLTSRIDAVGQQYNRGMGTINQPVSLLSPAARRALATLPGGADLIAENPMAATGQAAPPPPAAGAAPASGASGPPSTDMPPASLLNEGQATTFANGQVWTLRNGQPARVQ